MSSGLLGIFGGTFDPVHCGHIAMARELLDLVNFNEMRFLPCKQPLLKRASASVEQRLAMLHLALENEKKLSVDTRELDRDTPSYMFETLYSLRQDYPQSSLCLIIGMDALLSLSRWYKYQALIKLAHFIVINRADYNLPEKDEVAQLVSAHKVEDVGLLLAQPAGYINFQCLTPVDVSSSKIRQHIAQGKKVEAFLPEAVYQYIQEKRLYL
ncbi:MAG: nicotinate-nucleotide adenylyltransferase [Gammaproteobacteria bacterium]